MDQAIWASGTAPNDLLDWTYRAAQAVAADNPTLGLDVIADCANDREDAREDWGTAARTANAEVVWLETVCSDTVEHQRRIENRSTDIAGLSQPNWNAVAGRSYASWKRDHFTVDTARRSLE
jgi:predicted kinase